MCIPGICEQSRLTLQLNGEYKAISRPDLPEDTVELARFLIGKRVVRQTSEHRLSGLIVETEAYPPGDAASHAFRGETPRNRSLFRTRGHAYVYLAYGLSYLLNVSSEAEGVGAGVLIRALEPLEGVEEMRSNRRINSVRDLARGPGRLAQALEIDRGLDGVDLCRVGALWIAHGRAENPAVGTSPRIGVSRATDRLLRFYARGSPS